ncbi:hypothetical protein D3C74_485480 [compost metagenome]
MSDLTEPAMLLQELLMADRKSELAPSLETVEPHSSLWKLFCSPMKALAAS